ncbi:MAG TPA: lamin tail domain-containing protein [Candidatus Limnocylindrales bacterium]|nr:lamin tail domain-containing protein [Candidatus Limnocylindrales bacterium]
MISVHRGAAALVIHASVALAIAVGASAAVAPAPANAASCVRFVGSNFDAPGNDNYAENLNGEWVRIKNVCSTTKSIGGWKIHDAGRKHTYTIPSGYRIGAGRSVTLYTGRGTRTSAKLYWGRPYGAVWNNDGDKAYLRNGSGTILSTWTE